MARMRSMINVYKMEDLGTDVIILKWTMKTGSEGVDLIYMAQDMYRWRALANTVMNLRVPYTGEKCKGLCSMQLIFMCDFVNPESVHSRITQSSCVACPVHDLFVCSMLQTTFCLKGNFSNSLPEPESLHYA
jgi:hypothetical protein